MKKLKRMLLIHWHNYIKEVIELDTINFLTGKTASGKSTIIDALQLALLGDTGGAYFNKAANQKSARTLKSYLFGEKGDDGDTGFRYLRNQRFSSYVALEFEDTERGRKFTAGIVCDCYKDQSYDFKWFILHSSGFPDNLFIDEKSGAPYDIKGLKAFLANWLGGKKTAAFEFFDTNKRYQEVTLGKFGQVKHKYRVLLRKAVPFSPIADIEQFITESICDIKNRVNVEQMQNDIHQYKSLEADAQRMQKRIESLREISGLNKEYEGEKEKYQQQRFVHMRAGKEELIRQEKAFQKQIEGKRQLIQSNLLEMAALKEEAEALKEECGRMEQEYRTSDIVQRERSLKNQMEQLQEKIAGLEAGLDNVVKQARTYGADWESRVRKLADMGLWQDGQNGRNGHNGQNDHNGQNGRDGQNGQNDHNGQNGEVGHNGRDGEGSEPGRAQGRKGEPDPLRRPGHRPEEKREASREWVPELDRVMGFLEELKTIDRETAASYSFVEAARRFDALKEKAGRYQAELSLRAEQINKSIAELEATVSNLKKGIKPYPYEVTALKRLLEEELFRLRHRAVPVAVLADLLEIPEPRWRNAIEGYLDKQKFYLLVPEECYMDSLRIYNREKQARGILEAGLIDTGKLRRGFHKPPMEGSLAQEIQTDHEDARRYVDYLLGGVMKCRRIEELRNHKISITDEGMLYKGYVTRRIPPARYANPFIGRKSMELLLERKEEELARQRELYNEAAAFHRMAKTAAEAATLGLYEGEQHEKTVKESRELPGLRQQVTKAKEEYDDLDLLYVERLEQRIQRWKASVEEKDGRWHGLDKKNERLKTEIENLSTLQLPQATDRLAKLQAQIDEVFGQAWIEEVGEPRFQRECASRRSMEELQSGFYSAMRQTELKKDRLRRERTEKRSQYNGEYKMPFDIELEDNRCFDKELADMEDIRLPDYIEKIKDSRIKAYSQFRDDFIAKIRSNIETVTEQLKELNASLKQSVFGTDTYRFEKKPRPEYRAYYDMIMDPMLMDTGGWNLASQNFNQKYQKEIDELFQLLILNETNVTAERRAEYEKSVKKFTDYKTYLFFDLVVTNDQGEEQRLSKTLLKKSGGETQIPFYIALLASFSQVCRVRSKNQSNTIRLIILDEAFSKMDGERIRESIHLLRRFQLQAIFSAPPEKIPDIAPLVDRNIAVYKDSRHSFTRNFDPREIDEDLMEEMEG